MYFAVDEGWGGTLGVAVTCTVGCSGWVEGALSSCCGHLAEVEGAVGAARQFAEVDVEG